MSSIEPIQIIKINKNRFDIFMLFTRNSKINQFAKEIEYYSNENNSLLGVILFDFTDRDYNYVLTIRDENDQFRAFEIKTDFKSKEEAIEILKNSMRWHTAQDLKIISQGISQKGLKLFDIIISEEKLHPYFVRLNSDRGLIASKKVIIEISNHLDDIDGNFIEQFQSINGFDARVWEIYLFASLNELGFEILREFNCPDFIVKKDNVEIGIEAVTVSRKENLPKYLNTNKEVLRPDEIKEKIKNETPLRFGSSLFSKLSKEYWKLDHLKGKPLVFAIADFHDDGSMIWSFQSCVDYLYGLRQKLIMGDDGNNRVISEEIGNYVKDSGAEIPSGFFFQNNTENVSAILFSATGTLGKFTRMGVQAGFREKGQVVIRFGDRYDISPDTFKPISFRYRVKEDGTEKWSEGLNLFHNPNAKIPIDMEIFPLIAHHKLVGDELITWAPDFHPYSSMNINVVTK